MRKFPLRSRKYFVSHLKSSPPESGFRRIQVLAGSSLKRSTKTRGKETKFYRIENCCGCKFRPYCIRNIADKKRHDRVFEACYDLYEFKKQAISNHLSPKGIEMRVNRSAQVEGAFGVIKHGDDLKKREDMLSYCRGVHHSFGKAAKTEAKNVS